MHREVEHQLRRACDNFSLEERRLLNAAVDMAYVAHEGQVRKSSNSPYIIHPLEIALGLQQRFGHAPLTIAGILHDVVEDSEDHEIEEVYAVFGDDIGFIVDAVTKTHLHFHATNHQFDTYLDKLLFGGLHDVRVFLLKIADRDNNLLTLSSLKNHKQIRTSFETQAVFTPLRELLGYDRAEVTLGEITQSFQQFVTNQQLLTPGTLQNYLFGQTFREFTRETFREVYANCENVVWELHDLKKYEHLCQIESFEKAVQVLSLYTDGANFRVTFKLLGAHVIDQHDTTLLSMSSFSMQTPPLSGKDAPLGK